MLRLNAHAQFKGHQRVHSKTVNRSVQIDILGGEAKDLGDFLHYECCNQSMCFGVRLILDQVGKSYAADGVLSAAISKQRLECW